MGSLRRVLVSTAIVYAGKLFGILISAVTLGMIARNLGVEDFGRYSAVLAYSAVVVALADLGIGWLATREMALQRHGAIAALRRYKLVSSIIIIGASLGILPLLGYDPVIERGILTIALYTFFTSLNSLQLGILQGASLIAKTVIADTAGRLVNLVLAWFILYQGLGIDAQLMAVNLVGLTILLINGLVISRADIVRGTFDAAELKKLSRDLLSMPFVTILSYLVYRFDMLILARMAPAEGVGIYSAAYRIIDVAMAVPAILVGTLLPALTQVIHNKKEQSEFTRTFRFGYSVSLFLGGLATVACYTLAHVVIRVIVGQEFVDQATVTLFDIPVTATVVLQLLSAFLFLAFIGSLLSGILLAAKRQTVMIWIAGTALVLSVVGNILTIPHISYAGSALITVGTELLLVVGMMVALGTTGWLRYFWTPLGRAVLAVGVALALFHLLKPGSLGGAVVVACVGYLAVTILLGGKDGKLLRMRFAQYLAVRRP